MNPTILLIEDAADTGMIIKASFEKDYVVVQAFDLIHARKELMHKVPDLILLDANLPDGDGFHFCKWLRADDRYKHVPVIFLTGRSDPAEKTFAMKLGAQDYFVKPVKPKLLKARVDEFVKKQAKAA